jgi:redox-sensitive bicupin YhaK (pirin superfamily)
MQPDFQHIADLPTFSVAGASGKLLSGKVLVGTLLGAHSPALVHSELVGAELRMPIGTEVATLQLRPDWEYGVLVVQGSARVSGADVAVSNLEYLAPGQTEMTLESTDPNEPLVAILLGGQPFEERLVMWWNFIERSHAEIVRVRHEWNERESLGQNGSRFNDFVDNVGGWIPAPDLPNVELKSR